MVYWMTWYLNCLQMHILTSQDHDFNDTCTGENISRYEIKQTNAMLPIYM